MDARATGPCVCESREMCPGAETAPPPPHPSHPHHSTGVCTTGRDGVCMSWWESGKSGADGAIANCTCLDHGVFQTTGAGGNLTTLARHCSRWNCTKVRACFVSVRVCG